MEYHLIFLDRKLCRELARLPILWMKPKDRKVDNIHKILRRTIGEAAMTAILDLYFVFVSL